MNPCFRLAPREGHPSYATVFAGKFMPRHLYSLDVARGIAALSVVLWHWSHFPSTGGSGVETTGSEGPFYGLFFLFYERGALAVDFFFSLSGFVFFWLYRDRLLRREVGGWDFFVLRFSRLYPLHLLTLLVTAGLMCGHLHLAGEAFVYPHNDPYHFVLQLGMISHWGFQEGHSFNGPIWSVSIEVLLYASFFMLCRMRFARLWQLVAAVLLGGVMKELLYAPLGRGVFSFFLGGICYHILVNPRELLARATLRKVLYVLTVLAWLFALGSTAFELGTRGVERVPFLEARPVMAGKVIDKLAFYYGAGVLFPLTILSMVTLERERGGLGRRISFIGDISYSSYLLHFPLQLAFVLLFTVSGWSFAFFGNPLSLVLFYAVLIPLSLASYRWFERPMQRFLRRRMSRSNRQPGGAR